MIKQYLTPFLPKQAESDQNYAPEEAIEEEERLRKKREDANKEELQARRLLLLRHLAPARSKDSIFAVEKSHQHVSFSLNTL